MAVRFLTFILCAERAVTGNRIRKLFCIGLLGRAPGPE
jgi:hypothetical protein